jgi:fucose permease
LTLSFAVFILIGLNDGVVGVLLPSVIAHYHISTATVGLLFPASALGYLCAAFASGQLLERLGRRAFLAAGAAAWIVGMLVFATLPPFLVLLPALFCIGGGVAVLDAGLNAYIAGLDGAVGLLNYLHAFYGVGALLGPLLATAMLTSVFGWNTTYYVLAIGVAAALFSFLRRFERRSISAHHTEDDTGHSLLHATLRSPLIWLCATFLLLYVGLEVSLGAWSFTLLTVGLRTPTLQAGWMVSGYWLGLTLGRFILARVVERVGPRQAIQWLAVGVLAGITLVWFAPVTALTAVGLWLIGFSLGPIFPSVIAVINSATSARLRQSAIGFAASLGSMGGAFFPWVAANLTQRLGVWSLLPYAATLTVAMLALWLWLRTQLATLTETATTR